MFQPRTVASRLRHEGGFGFMSSYIANLTRFTLQRRIRYFPYEGGITSVFHRIICSGITGISFRQQDNDKDIAASGPEACLALKSTSEALKNYLCNCKNLKLDDARFIAQNAPMFTLKLKASVDDHITRQGMDDSRIAFTEDYLIKEAVDELQPFLESIGMQSHLFEEVQAMVRTAAGGVGDLLTAVAILEMLGFPKTSIWNLMARNRHLLSSSAAQIDKTIQFLRGFGLNKRKIGLLIQEVPEIIRPNLEEELAPFLQKLRELKVRKPVMRILLRNHAKFLAFQPQWNFQENFEFLSRLGLDEAGINKVVRKHPLVLIQSVTEKLIPKVEFLKNEGIRDQDIAYFLSCFPSFFSYDVQESLKPKLEYLSSLGLTRSVLASIMTKYPPILGCSIEQKMKPLVALLETCGIKGRVFEKLLIGTPSIFGSSIDKTITKILEMLKGLEEKPMSLSIALAWGCRNSRVSMKQKMKYLKSVGLSPNDINAILMAEPFLIRVDINVLKLKVDYFTKDMKFSIKELVKCPAYLSRHIMRKIKPRYKVLSLLKSKGVLDNISLVDLTKISDSSFVEKFVKPHSDCQKIYSRLIANSNRRHLRKSFVVRYKRT
ncbi:hypothetical protein O6H91_07G129500 [Diphasiastrum complanatum]|uniref:Uncharacterized protein n=2 Tax=Diphasiastrum complanatum TaxID=34168 RepID=A0ACC2D9P5_DIPCM|nr:hypothetical protein O6H91_07G129500 [Diphasiastrum complanatum]KAJ7551007.1 hypothetical protein O6H91_07G129500 [Diphasiastrum complanatum]